MVDAVFAFIFLFGGMYGITFMLQRGLFEAFMIAIAEQLTLVWHKIVPPNEVEQPLRLINILDQKVNALVKGRPINKRLADEQKLLGEWAQAYIDYQRRS